MVQSRKLLLVCVAEELVTALQVELARAGVDARVESLAGLGLMRAALQRETYDAVIAGDAMPACPPERVLADLVACGLDVPVFLLVEPALEEAAAAAMRDGAADYALTTGLVRVPPMLARAWRDRERRRELTAAAQRMEASESLFRRMAENAKDFIYRYRLRPVAGFEYVSPSVSHITGYTAEEHYRNPDLHRQLVHPEDLPFFLAALQSPATQTGALLLRWVRKDGKVTWTEQTLVRHHDAEGGLMAVEGIVRDVTRRMRVEQALSRKTSELESTMERLYKVQDQLVQSSKLAALGQFAAGMAHDFNNLLTPILGFADLSMRQLPEGHAVTAYVREISTTCRRAAGLIRQLLTFAGQQPLQPRLLDLNERVAAVSAVLRGLVGEDVTLVTATAAPEAYVRIDPCQLEQLLINLAANARDAMPGGGLLTIETEALVLDEGFCRGRADLKPGEYVRVGVRDTGRGIDPAIRDRIFEPFFTTKGLAKGTGLGLSICHGVVNQSGGYIQVDSAVGQGTVFHIYFPRAAAPAVALAPVAELEDMPRGTERVLLVEDEPLVRSLAADLLRKQGYHVIVAEDGVDALRVAGSTSEPVHLLLTDVIMPRMGGKGLAEELQAQRPDTRVLYISGYPDGLIEGQGIDHDSASILRKPFSLAGLAQKVREVLDRPVSERLQEAHR